MRVAGSRPRNGFTLLELIVVITIIGLLGAMVVVQVKGAGPKARRARVDNDLRQIISVAEMIQVETGSYPETIEAMVNAKDENGNDLAGSLKTDGREGSRPRTRLRNGLLVTQAALSVMLLVGAGLFVKSLRNVHAVDLGYEPSHLVVAMTDLRGLRLEP